MSFKCWLARHRLKNFWMGEPLAFHTLIQVGVGILEMEESLMEEVR